MGWKHFEVKLQNGDNERLRTEMGRGEEMLGMLLIPRIPQNRKDEKVIRKKNGFEVIVVITKRWKEMGQPPRYQNL